MHVWNQYEKWLYVQNLHLRSLWTHLDVRQCFYGGQRPCSAFPIISHHIFYRSVPLSSSCAVVSPAPPPPTGWIQEQMLETSPLVPPWGSHHPGFVVSTHWSSLLPCEGWRCECLLASPLWHHDIFWSFCSLNVESWAPGERSGAGLKRTIPC